MASKNGIIPKAAAICAIIGLLIAGTTFAVLADDRSKDNESAIAVEKAMREAAQVRLRVVENATIQMATDIRWMRQRIEEREKETP